MNLKVIRRSIVGIAALVVMVLFSACAGVGTNAGASTLNMSGSVVSVDTQHNSVTVSVNGQTKTINNVPSNVLTALQGQVGKIYAFQVTQNSDGSYNIVSGTNVTPEANEGITPETNNETPGVNEPGNIQFIGNIRSSSNGSIVVSMPDGSSLSMSTNAQTDLGDFNNTLPGVNTRVKVEANANTDGSFTATKIGNVDSSDDPTMVKFQGVTSQAVGSDRVIHFTVGNKSFSFPIASNADLTDFNGNAQSIQSGVHVKMTVQFSGTGGSVIDLGNSNQ
jgi:Domain of unknown function (DUF5666)